MSTPIPGRRTRLLMSTCRSCGYTERSATPVVATSFTPLVSPVSHSTMFRPGAGRLVSPKVSKPGAFRRFEEAYLKDDTKRAIAEQRRLTAAADAIDPKLKQIGRADR